MQILIGSSGLIGKTLLSQNSFDFEFNSQNIKTFNSVVPDGADLYLACPSATKWKVDQNLFDDLLNINLIIENLKTRSYRNIYLFSTIDVYSNSPLKSNELTIPIVDRLNYGTNRYLFEIYTKQLLSYDTHYTIRLPALFGKFLKKNILFDLLNEAHLDKIDLNSTYQWYDLKFLTQDLNTISNLKFPIVNLFSEPIKTKLIVSSFFPHLKECCMRSNNPLKYDYNTITTSSGYWRCSKDLLNLLEGFIDEARHK